MGSLNKKLSIPKVLTEEGK